MRVVIVGATGNVGTSLVRSLAETPEVDSILALARRLPEWHPARTTWVAADVRTADLVRHFKDADAVVHLAWSIQPSRNERALEATNVAGSKRVFQAVADAGVPVLVYASSVGAYSSGPKDRRVDESWPTDGIPSSFYSRHKALVERVLDQFESENEGIRVVRLRPGLIFKGEAATEIRRLFAGPFLPGFLLDRRLIPIVPAIPGLRAQAVHSLDVAEAYRAAILRDVRGAFNVAAEPVLDAAVLARVLGARPVRVPAPLVRGLTEVSWRLRLQPTPPGWLDMALKVPLMDTSRAHRELEWRPRYDSIQAVEELREAMHHGEGLETPPLDPATSGPLREREIRTGIGSR
jgi:UDP-glucose 4-epimerase